MPQVDEGPKELNRLLEEAYQKALKQYDGDQEKASATAWKAAAEAGWHKREDGTWAMRRGTRATAHAEWEVPIQLAEDKDKTGGYPFNMELVREGTFNNIHLSADVLKASMDAWRGIEFINTHSFEDPLGIVGVIDDVSWDAPNNAIIAAGHTDPTPAGDAMAYHIRMERVGVSIGADADFESRPRKGVRYATELRPDHAAAIRRGHQAVDTAHVHTSEQSPSQSRFSAHTALAIALSRGATQEGAGSADSDQTSPEAINMADDEEQPKDTDWKAEYAKLKERYDSLKAKMAESEKDKEEAVKQALADHKVRVELEAKVGKAYPNLKMEEFSNDQLQAIALADSARTETEQPEMPAADQHTPPPPAQVTGAGNGVNMAKDDGSLAFFLKGD